ncbi:MAG TPA: TonB family protein [Polyangiaceae bacterium]|jgi:protein TonB|nr:TonB family protein [Polyangiaceae bacterium]
MRLTGSLLIATALHGVVIGLGATWSQPAFPLPAATPAHAEIEVEIIAARPDPIAEAVPVAATPTASRSPLPAAPVVAKTSIARAPRAATTGAPSERVPQEILTDPEPAASEEPVIAEPPSIAPAAPTVPAVSSPSVAPAARARGSGLPAPSHGEHLVSAAPHYRTNPPPEYPIPSRRRGEEGVVFLNVVVQLNGLPASVSLNRSSGFPLLDRAALEAVRGWSFEPARAAGVPVSSTVVVPVRFSLSQ